MADDTSYGSTFKGMAEAFTIFAKYSEGKWDTCAEHDEIFSGPDVSIVSDEDKERLDELGWSIYEERFHKNV